MYIVMHSSTIYTTYPSSSAWSAHNVLHSSNANCSES